LRLGPGCLFRNLSNNILTIFWHVSFQVVLVFFFEFTVGFPGKANFGATAWYHYDCIWDDRENLKSVDQAKSVKSNVDGYSKLNEEDQKKLERDLYMKKRETQTKGLE
jgi:hypothetical protein